jgi:hypothetical protein
MPDPNVRDLLLSRVDEITTQLSELIEEVRTVTEQLEPERARSCSNAITMASVMVDEIPATGPRPGVGRPEPVSQVPPVARGRGHHPNESRLPAYLQPGSVSVWPGG